jgi:hypothetical protein
MSQALVHSGLSNVVIKGLRKKATNIDKIRYLMGFFSEDFDLDECVSSVNEGSIKGDLHVLALAGYQGEVREYARNREPWYSPTFATLDPSTLAVSETYEYKDQARGQDPWTMVVVANEFREGDNGRKYFFAAIREDLLFHN